MKNRTWKIYRNGELSGRHGEFEWATYEEAEAALVQMKADDVLGRIIWGWFEPTWLLSQF